MTHRAYHSALGDKNTQTQQINYQLSQSDKTDEGRAFLPQLSFSHLVGTTILMSEDERGEKIGTLNVWYLLLTLTEGKCTYEI